MTVTEDRTAPPPSRRVVSPKLIGRSAELETLAATLAAAPALGVIEGEAGIGKSRLVAELAKHQTLAGRRWLLGACRHVREPFPMGPVIEAFRVLGEEVAAARMSPVAGALRPLLPELAPWLPLPPDPLGDRGAERHRVFRALVELLAVLGPAVLVLEDLHWCDEQTLEFLTYLVAAPPPATSILLTYRSEEVTPAVRTVTAKLPAGVRSAHLELAPLDVEGTRALALSILDTDRVSTEFAEHLRARSSGVPFALEELLALLREQGNLVRTDSGWSRRTLDHLHVPAGIRDPVLERLTHLTPHGRAVVEAAAVLAHPVTEETLAAVCAATGTWTPEGLDDALATGVLTEHTDTIGFRHTLAAQAVYESLPRTRRTTLHHHAAAVLQEQGQPPLGQIAHHLQHAGHTTQWATAAEHAADQAIQLGNDTEAMSLLSEILEKGDPQGADAGRVAVKLGRTAHQIFRSSPDLIDQLLRVLEQDVPAAVRGELAFWASTAVQDATRDPDLKRRLLLDATRNLGDNPRLQAWAMVGLGLHTFPNVTADEHIEWLHRALDVVAKVDDASFSIFLRGKIAMVLMHIGDPSWQRLWTEIERDMRHPPRDRFEANALMSVGMMAGYTGRYTLAEDLLGRAQVCATRCENRALAGMIRSIQSLVDCCRAHWSSLGSTATALMDELADAPLSSIDAELAGAVMALASGQESQARPQLADVAHRAETMHDADILALALSSLARLDLSTATSGPTAELEDTCARIDRFLATLEAKRLWAPVARVLPHCVRVLLATSREAEARDLVASAQAALAHLDVPLALAAADWATGYLLDSSPTGTSDTGEHFLAAADRYDELGCEYEAAQTREDAGDALARAGDARAGEQFRAALQVYRRLGATWDEARCSRLARNHGIRVAVPHRGGRKGYGRSLSPREQDVARLAAAGLSNREIGDRLFLAPTTVDKHLGRAMRKLDVHSRAALGPRLADKQTQG